MILTERQINPNSFTNFWEDAPKMNSYSIHAVQKLLMRKSMFNLVKINKTKCDATIHTRLQFHTERKLQEPSIVMWPLWHNIFVLILIKEIYYEYKIYLRLTLFHTKWNNNVDVICKVWNVLSYNYHIPFIFKIFI